MCLSTIGKAKERERRFRYDTLSVLAVCRNTRYSLSRRREYRHDDDEDDDDDEKISVSVK